MVGKNATKRVYKNSAKSQLDKGAAQKRKSMTIASTLLWTWELAQHIPSNVSLNFYALLWTWELAQHIPSNVSLNVYALLWT